MANSLSIFAATKAVVSQEAKSLSNVPVSRGWWPLIREPFTGAWQRNKEERIDTLLQYPTLYACVSRIATDIGKMPFSLKAKNSNGIWEVIESPAFSPVLRKPNHYQTAQQFREHWSLSKKTQGNTYALKGRDMRGVVIGLYILDPCRVMPLVSDSGEVFYQLYTDNLNLLPDGETDLIVPATEIIHDRCICPFHPLIGLPPIAAAYWPALKNMRILRSSSEFFANNAQPSGILSAPGAISDGTADRLRAYWNENFTGANAGKVAVVGDGLQFVSLASKSVDSQMVEQLRYSDEQICQPFGIPPFKVGLGSIPAGLGVDAINQLYYDDALQADIQAMECLLSEGLNTYPYKVDLDESVLMRMDAGKKADYHKTLIDGNIETINDARMSFNLAPLAGGNTVYMQMQDMPLDQVRNNVLPSPVANPASEDADPVDQASTNQLVQQSTDKALVSLWKVAPETLHA
ncbi:phage portal protein [Pseudomonas aeruginosa]|uniref:phage portal protein n=1 Tax=Pseudomonas aeruginosa TaxID=287 RepID=UPI002270659C|nr:phage portal protein [Pseudomonas aeruginosa]MCY0330067.1 phage portal protein [Pseudomonas aeruginosa]MCY0347189.1 phage portal protein [Pseudomonas aeruginosa]HBO3174923.1 phage portal protein [Pseudomonas aeruginosa]HBO4702176.1 phage portal protein [Pseudomonas aeruginosa]HCR1638130.1 phage portal protein [Pseudomonas aeruginosa]